MTAIRTDSAAVNGAILRYRIAGIVGDEDASDIAVIADRLAAGIPGAHKVVMSGTAHLPNMEQPTTFNRIVREFLASLTAA